MFRSRVAISGVFVVVSCLGVLSSASAQIEGLPAYPPEYDYSNDLARPAWVDPDRMPSPEALQEGQNAYAAKREKAEQHEAWLETADAQRARDHSANAYATVDREEAADLFIETFPRIVAQLDQDPARAIDDLNIKKIHPDGSAVVVNDGQSNLIDSPIPLTDVSPDGDIERVDLDLKREGESLFTENGLVETSLPLNIDDPATVGSGLKVELSEPNHSVEALRIGEQTVMYPDAMKDTDLILAPVTTGLEILAQIRSESASSNLPLDLNLGSGSTFRSLPDNSIEILNSEGTATGAITAPYAIDSQGQNVPTDLRIEGDEIIMSTAHRDTDFAYPILVDPIVQNWSTNSSGNTYNWLNGRTDGLNEWDGWKSPAYSPPTAGICGFDLNKIAGLLISTPGSCYYPPNTWAHWAYYKPGGDRAYITSAKFTSLGMNNASCSAYEPHGYVGVWSVARTEWASGTTAGLRQFGPAVNYPGPVGGTGSVTLSPGTNRTTSGDTAIVGMGTPQSWSGLSASCGRAVHLGGAQISITDDTQPTVAVTAGGPWVSDTSSSVTFSANDSNGLGIAGMGVLFPQAGGGWFGTHNVVTASGFSCSGLRSNPCLQQPGSKTVNFPTAELPEGISPVQAWAWDPLFFAGDTNSAHLGSQNVNVRVDRGGPIVEVSGSAAPGGEPGVDLAITATDGSLANNSTIRSGIRSVRVVIDDGDPETAEVVAHDETISCLRVNGTCPQSIERQLQLPWQDLAGENRQIKLTVIDQAGNIGHFVGSTPAERLTEWTKTNLQSDLVGQDQQSEDTSLDGDDLDDTEIAELSALDNPPPCSNPGELKTRYGEYTRIRNKKQIVVGVRGTPCRDIIDLRVLKTRQGWKSININGFTIRGGEGGDRLFGAHRSQFIFGGEGNDLLMGRRNNDTLTGGDGHDALYGGVDDDPLLGGRGGDLLVGGPGSDDLSGQRGNDVIRGGQGLDRMSGGPHFDTVSYADAVPPGFDNYYENPDQSFKGDLIRTLPVNFPPLASEKRGVFIQVTDGTAGAEYGVDKQGRPVAYNGTPRTGGGTDFLCLITEEKPRPCRSGQPEPFEQIIGSPYADVILGSSKDEKIYGGGGPDLIRGRGGTDFLSGGREGDYITQNGPNADGTIHGGPSFETESINHCVSASGVQESRCSSLSDDYSVTADVVASNHVRIERNAPDDTSNLPNWSDADLAIIGSDEDDDITVKYRENLNDVLVTLEKQEFDQRSGVGCHYTVNQTTGIARQAECESIDRTRTFSGNGRRALGSVTVSGRSGNDDITIDEDMPRWINTNIAGGLGRDDLKGGDSEDTITDGDNQGIDASKGYEDLLGGNGDDAIINNQGVDHVEGQGGNDLLLSTSLCDTTSSATEHVWGGPGVNSAQWAQLPGIEQSTDGVFVDSNLGKAGSVTPNKTNGCPGSSTELSGIDDLETSASDDAVYGDGGDNFILPRGGRDFVSGRKGDDTIRLNDGLTDHTAYCGAGTDTMVPDRNKLDFEPLGVPTPYATHFYKDATRCSKPPDSIDADGPRYGDTPKAPYDETLSASDPVPTSLGSDPGDNSLYRSPIPTAGKLAYEEGDLEAPGPETGTENPDGAALVARYSLNDESSSFAAISGGLVEPDSSGSPQGLYIDSTELGNPTSPPSALEGPDIVDGPLSLRDDVAALELNQDGSEPEGDSLELTTEWDPADFAETGYSVELWVKFDAASDGDDEVVFSRGDDSQGLRLWRDGSGLLRFRAQTSETEPSVKMGRPLTTSVWHHVVGTLSPDRYLTMIVDGFEYSLGQDSTVFPSPTPNSPNVIGAEAGDVDPESPAAIDVDDVRIYEGELTEAEASAHLLTSDVIEEDHYLRTKIDPSDVADQDGDGVSNGLDNCPDDPNPNQADSDDDGVGDTCQAISDGDEDGVRDSLDNCPDDYNVRQQDSDSDGTGDACEFDDQDN